MRLGSQRWAEIFDATGYIENSRRVPEGCRDVPERLYRGATRE